MPATYDTIVHGGTVMLPSGAAICDVAISGGRFQAFGDLKAASAAERIDATGLHVLPGVIDSQVHFREPGSEHKEDLATGTAAAALGGVVAVFEMPNTKPPTTTAEALADKLNRARGRTWCDHAFWAGGADTNADRVDALERLEGVPGIKVFMGSSTGNLLVSDDATLERIVARLTRRMAVHCEDEQRMIERRPLIPAGAGPAWHPVWRDEESAIRATRRLITLAERHRKRVHVLHVTSAEELELIARHKDLVSCEALVNHLTLHAPECYERLGTYAQQNPPIRGLRHQQALWAAIADGTVDVVATDHAPHTRAEKDKGYGDSPSGMPGVQTLVPVMLTHVNAGRLSLQRFVDLTSAGPQRLFGLAGKGRIAKGYDGDLTLVDLRAQREITDAQQATRSGWTPFAGMRCTGWPIATIVRGRTVMRDGALIGQPIGEPVRFN